MRISPASIRWDPSYAVRRQERPRWEGEGWPLGAEENNVRPKPAQRVRANTINCRTVKPWREMKVSVAAAGDYSRKTGQPASNGPIMHARRAFFLAQLVRHKLFYCNNLRLFVE